MDDNPVIIQCSEEIYFFTVPLPSGFDWDTPTGLNNGIGTSVLLRQGDGYFMAVIYFQGRRPEYEHNAESYIKRALTHIWRILVANGVAEGEMPPEPISGTPFDMMPN